ncbi:MAG: hypothetical protein LBT60_03715 [Oscillospiraceae bacterium]|jgi:hypothetical protein|nr:hypothetical protein [Oscillospiraceae bacterium]
MAEKRKKAVPAYVSFPTQADAPDPKTGQIEPGEEEVKAVRNWGIENKL